MIKFLIQCIVIVFLTLIATVVVFAQNNAPEQTSIEDIKTVLQIISPAILCWITFKVELASLKSTVKDHHENKLIHMDNSQLNILKDEMVSSKECHIIQTGCSNEINAKLAAMKEDVTDMKSTLRNILERLNKPI